MRHTISCFFLFTLIIYSCHPFPGPRNINWEKEWNENQTKLKALAQEILIQGGKKYSTGDNDFPDNFDYPFDEGFSIKSNGSVIDSLDIKNLTIKFYIDRGLLDHYSAFIYCNDSTFIKEFDEKVNNGGNDFKIEPNWYMIND